MGFPFQLTRKTDMLQILPAPVVFDSFNGDIHATAREIYPHVPAKQLQTRRPIEETTVDRILRLIVDADCSGVSDVNRIRCYSPMGFVPNSYRGARIQFIEATRVNGYKWSIALGWTGASRSRGAGSLTVIA